MKHTEVGTRTINRYDTPQLVVYGKLADLTAAGSGNVVEAFVQVQPVMVCATVVSNRACNSG